jgi:hypothetical protein
LCARGNGRGRISAATKFEQWREQEKVSFEFHDFFEVLSIPQHARKSNQGFFPPKNHLRTFK